VLAATLKFGALDTAVVERVGAATPDELERILSADSLDTVIAG
jgi:hypothetical protein